MGRFNDPNHGFDKHRIRHEISREEHKNRVKEAPVYNASLYSSLGLILILVGIALFFIFV